MPCGTTPQRQVAQLGQVIQLYTPCHCSIVVQAMRLVAGRELGGLVNTGYWGIPVQARQAYSLRLFLKFAEAPEKVLPPQHDCLEGEVSAWATGGWARADLGGQAGTERSTRFESRVTKQQSCQAVAG